MGPGDEHVQELYGSKFLVVNGNYYKLDDVMSSLRVVNGFGDPQYMNIKFQEGPIQEVGVNGVGIEDVIDLLVDRLRMFNDGPMRCRENSLAITALEEARGWLRQRTIDRIRAGVEGYHINHEQAVPEANGEEVG